MLRFRFAIEQAGGTSMWTLSGKQHQLDDCTPSEISAADLWTMWRRRYPGDRLPILWLVHGDAVGEIAPFLGGGKLARDFLTFYTWPIDADGARLRWTDLAIEDKLWNSDRADNGGFIQEHSGWKPSPFQSEMDVALLERVLGTEPPA